MTRKLLVLSCAAAALVAGAAIAQDAVVNPPANPSDVDRPTDESVLTSTPIDTAVNPPLADNTSLAETTTTSADTPTAQNASAQISAAQVSTDGAWTTQSEGAAATASVDQPSYRDRLAEAADADDSAATPAAKPASASVSAASASEAYATNIANAPGGVFKPMNLGNYPMSHYASPSRPLPYDQVDAYLKASPSQQLAQNWWSGTELASTAPASDVSASTPAASDVSATVTTSSASQASGTAGLPGDTRVGLNDDTSTSAGKAPSDSELNPQPAAPELSAPTTP